METPEAESGPEGRPIQAASPSWRKSVVAQLRSIAWTLLWMWLIFMVVQSLRGGVAVVGQAPAFALVDMAGQQLHSADLRGKPTVLYFWATWCTACKLTSPSVDALTKNHPEINVVGIAADEPADLTSYLADTPRQFRTAIATKAISDAYGIRALPTTVVVDAAGTIVWSRVGVVLPFELALHLP